MATINFESTPYAIDRWTIVPLPDLASARLPSRGQVAVRGEINRHPFETVLEPDGSGGHWLRLDEKLKAAAAVTAGGTATLQVEPVKDWPEPEVPGDLKTALAAAPSEVQDLWKDITSMARWEWVRWVNATRNAQTRRRRVEVTISKMAGGKRRPCCFNLAGCTDPFLSRNGRLMEPSP